MRKLVLIAGLAALAMPGLAAAQSSCYEQQHDNRVAGTVVGAGVGALIGSSVAGHGSKGAGAVVGAIGGGLIGNAAGGSSVNCDNAGYYDSTGGWHAANGYYDGGGRWVSGYYDNNGHWVAGDPAAGGYGDDASFRGGPSRIDARADFLGRKIRRGDDSGALSNDDANDDTTRLDAIQRRKSWLADEHGGLTYDDRADISQRLDSLSADVDSQGGANRPRERASGKARSGFPPATRSNYIESITFTILDRFDPKPS